MAPVLAHPKPQHPAISWEVLSKEAVWKDLEQPFAKYVDLDETDEEEAVPGQSTKALRMAAKHMNPSTPWTGYVITCTGIPQRKMVRAFSSFGTLLGLICSSYGFSKRLKCLVHFAQKNSQQP